MRMPSIFDFRCLFIPFAVTQVAFVKDLALRTDMRGFNVYRVFGWRVAVVQVVGACT